MNVKVSEILLFLYLFLKNPPEIFYPDSFENWSIKCTQSKLIMIRIDNKIFRVSMSLDITRFLELYVASKAHFSLIHYRSKALNIVIRVILMKLDSREWFTAKWLQSSKEFTAAERRNYINHFSLSYTYPD